MSQGRSGTNQSRSKRKGSGTDNKSTTTKRTKITNFTFENVEEEIQLIMEEFGKNYKSN